MNRRVQVLDHGYLDAVEFWGSDESIIRAARMSTQKGFEGWGPVHSTSCQSVTDDAWMAGHAVAACNCSPKPGDEKLLRYLWKNNHATPFEMAGATFEVQAPIFVIREWMRHRSQSFNEMSARYAPLPDVNYIPSVERLMMGSDGTNKQAGLAPGATALTAEGAELFRESCEVAYSNAQTLYELYLSKGVPKELARILLPVGRYSRMRVSANLRNWLAFLTLRNDPKAQWEIRQYAEQVQAMLAVKFPRTLALFEEGR